MGERLPLATIHDAVIEFLRGRDDAAIFGAQAVNAYIDEPRMTQEVDILCPRAAELAEELRVELNERFHIAVRIRVVKQGIGYRLYQVRQPKNRHLVDIRAVAQLPPCNAIDGILVPTPAELICQKVLSMSSRVNTRKGMMDAADLRGLLLQFPELKSLEGLVADSLRAAGGSEEVHQAWAELAAAEILPEDDDDGFYAYGRSEMKVVIQVAETDDAEAWAMLQRHSPGVALPNRTFVVSQEAADALRQAGIQLQVLSDDARMLTEEGVAVGERI